MKRLTKVAVLAVAGRVRAAAIGGWLAAGSSTGYGQTFSGAICSGSGSTLHFACCRRWVLVA